MEIERVLVGYTGFVGSNLLQQRSFDLCVNRSNLRDLQSVQADLLVIAGLPAEKWRANQDPVGDLCNMRALQGALASVNAKQVVVVSTVDVYPSPMGVSESSPIDVAAAQPYGKHRHAFEGWGAGQFPRSSMIRLPGLFGSGLKKNVLHDLVRDHMTERIHPESAFQWYPIARLSSDIEALISSGLPLVNAATEPICTRDIAERFFPSRELQSQPSSPVRYDMQSEHSQLFGGAGPYWMDRRAVMDALQTWLRSPVPVAHVTA